MLAGKTINNIRQSARKEDNDKGLRTAHGVLVVQGRELRSIKDIKNRGASDEIGDDGSCEPTITLLT